MTMLKPVRCSGSAIIHRAVWTLVLSALPFVFGCGSDSSQSANTAKYPTGISEDVEQQLKYDARVDSFDQDGENLIVNVNDEWVKSPPGMQERSVGQWFSLWHSSHSGGVIIQHNGDKVASWTSDHGYRPASKSKKEESAGT